MFRKIIIIISILISQFQTIESQNTSTFAWSTFTRDNSGLPDNMVTCLLRNSSDSMYIGTASGLALMIDSSIVPIAGTSNWFIRCLARDSDGRLWIGTAGEGLKVMNNNGSFASFGNAAGQLTDLFVNAIAFDNSGLWVGTETEGLFQFDGLNWFRYHPNTTNGLLPFQRINAISIDTLGNRWIATHNAGLYNFPQNGNIYFFNVDSGFPTNSIQSIATEGDFFWLGFASSQTNNHLVRWNRLTKSVETFNENISNNVAMFPIKNIFISSLGQKWIGHTFINSHGVSLYNDTTFAKAPIQIGDAWVPFVYCFENGINGKVYAGHIQGLSINRIIEGLSFPSQSINNKVVAFPNPASNCIHLTFNGDFARHRFTIIDISGRIISEGISENETDISSLSNGPYFYVWEKLNERGTMPFIKD
jgi:ligand-binding sensor domain-containing protein